MQMHEGGAPLLYVTIPYGSRMINLSAGQSAVASPL